MQLPATIGLRGNTPALGLCLCVSGQPAKLCVEHRQWLSGTICTALVTADASHYRVQSALMQPASPITTQRRAPSALNATATMAFGVFAAVLLRAYIIAIVPAQILLRLRSRSSELMAFSVLGPVLDTALLPRQLRASG